MVAYLRSHPALNFAPSRRPQRATVLLPWTKGTCRAYDHIPQRVEPPGQRRAGA